jgi:hypothetical protein
MVGIQEQFIIRAGYNGVHMVQWKLDLRKNLDIRKIVGTAK